MRIESTTPPEIKQRYKVVRTDDYQDIPGEIITADEDAGVCVLQPKPNEENKEYSLGQGSIKIVPRR